MDTINVIGLGYIGLPTALIFASSGVKVVGTDYNKDLVGKLNKSEMPFEENGLEDLFNVAVKNEIRFTTDYIPSDYYIVAVPTPFDPVSKRVDSTFVVKAVNSILEVCSENAIIIIESTIAPGTIDESIRPAIERSHKNLRLAHAPERILPGQMLYELANNSRTIGVDDAETGEKVKELYAHFCRGEIVITNIKTAEMTKVVENTYRDINIAFANELAEICRSDGMDVYEVIKIANRHPRVNILSPGPGVGGHCIAVDPWFLVGRYQDKAKLIKQAREVNSHMPEVVADRIAEVMRENGITDYSKVGLYGLTYKENINDIRESPSLQLLDVLKKRNVDFCNVYDPYVQTQMFDKQSFTLSEFLDKSEMVVVMVAHNEIRNSVYSLSGKVVLDTRDVVHNINKVYSL